MHDKSKYLDILVRLLLQYRSKHLWVFVVSSLLVAVLSSFFFVSSSVKYKYKQSIEAHPDFVVQKFRAGKVEDMPLDWKAGFEKIPGVVNIQERVYGVHFYDPAETYFTIVGIDFSDARSVKLFKDSFPKIKIDEFLSKDNMIIGSGVQELFDYYEYEEYYIFRPPDKGKQKVYFHSNLPKDSQIYTNDMILMDINLARKILGTSSENATDIAIYIDDKVDVEDIKIGLILTHFDMRIISKEELFKHYENLFNYKGGVFLALYSFSFITFLLLLYQRYSNTLYRDAKEIAILRMCGWNIADLIYLKLFENLFVVVSSYMTGVIIGYLYVYNLGAPLIKEIFLGFKNLSNSVAFDPHFEISSLLSSFFLFVVPFILVVLIPVWKVAIKEPTEVLR